MLARAREAARGVSYSDAPRLPEPRETVPSPLAEAVTASRLQPAHAAADPLDGCGLGSEAHALSQKQDSHAEKTPPAMTVREPRNGHGPPRDEREWTRISEQLDLLERVYRAHGFDEEVRRLEEKRRDLLDPSVFVFVIGEGKFGKSSLINHLLGVKVADVGKVPKTWRVDLYRPASDGKEHARVTRYGSSISAASEVLSLSAAFEACAEQEPEVLDRVAQGPSRGEDSPADVVAFEGQITQVDWYRSGLALDERVTLVDTPGFAQPRGATTARADALRRAEGVAFDIDDISEFYYHRSDLVLWAFKATKLEDADTLKSLKLLSRETKRVLGVITHWDRIEEAERPARLREARHRYGEYVVDFICVDCKGDPVVPKEGVGRLQEMLRGEANRANAVKMESARAYCTDQAKFAADWLQSLGEGLVRNVAEIAMYCNEASDLLLRSVAQSRTTLLNDVQELVSSRARSGLLGILQSEGTPEKKQERIGKFLQISDLNDRLIKRLQADGEHLAVQGSNLARQRKLQQVVIKGRGIVEYRSLQARIDPPKSDKLAVSLSGVAVPSIDSGVMDFLFDIFQGSWIGSVAEFFGGRSAGERQSEAVQEATTRIRTALHDQIHEASTVFTKSGAAAILASADSGVTHAFPGHRMRDLRARAKLIDEHVVLLSKVDSSVSVQPRFESHYRLWSPIDDGRQAVLDLFCGWFDQQQVQIRREVMSWGGEALRACPLSRSFVYACVRNVIHETKQWFAVTATIPLKTLASRSHPSLDFNKLADSDGWIGQFVANIETREPFQKGSGFLKEVFPDLPDDAFDHFELGGLGHAFSGQLSRDFITRYRERFVAAPPIHAIAETRGMRFSIPPRLMTRSFLGAVGGAAGFSALATFVPPPGVAGQQLAAAVASLYGAEFHTLLHSAWAAGRAGIAVLMIQYLFFLRDKHNSILSIISERASRTVLEECASAWKDVSASLDPARARTIVAEYTLVGMRPLDYARDGLIEKYGTDGRKRDEIATSKQGAFVRSGRRRGTVTYKIATSKQGASHD